MLQRASLCRALVHDPQLLLLDEPFGALDQFTREELWAIMQELWITPPKPTVILVTHDLREAGYLANRICVMRARPGRIVDDSVVPFPRPRTMDMIYDPAFVTLTQRLRELIVEVAATMSQDTAKEAGMNNDNSAALRLRRAHHRLVRRLGAALHRSTSATIVLPRPSQVFHHAVAARARAVAAHGADALHHAARLRARRRRSVSSSAS